MKDVDDDGKASHLLSLPFVSLLAVQLLTLLGCAILSFACPLFLLERTGSATLFGTVSAISFVPYVLLAPVGGVLADLPGRRWTMAAVPTILAVSTLVFSVCRGSASPTFSVALLLCVLYGTQAIIRPIVQTAMADLVDPGDVERGVAVVSQITMGTNILGPVAGAAAYGFLGIESACMFALGGFAFATILGLALSGLLGSVSADSEHRQQISSATNYAQAMRYLRRAPSLCITVASAALFNVLLAGTTMGTPIIVTQRLRMPSTWVGIIEAGMGAGGLVGGFLVSLSPVRFSFSRLPRHIALAVAGVLPPALALLLGVRGDAMCLVLVVGLTWLMVWANIVSIEIVGHVQQTVPRNICGKVLALLYAVLSCATPLGQLVYGAAYDALSPAAVYLIMMALLIILTAVFSGVCHKTAPATR